MAKDPKENNTKAADLLQKRILKDQRKRERKEAGVIAKPRGKPFAEGEDERRNVHGSKPRTATLLKEMILNIAAEEMKINDPTDQKDKQVTIIYWMIKKMMLGKGGADHIEVLNRGFGKIPDETRNLSAVDEFILKNMDLFTDGQIERMQAGGDKSEILAELLRDAVEILKKEKGKK